jgi:predicted unusual protein kinase regulating ubiquinone biosynthesis (AarF/ABC1/UbiB family)
MYKYSFRLPPYYTLLVRSLSVLEGIALASDPNYKVSCSLLHVLWGAAAAVFAPGLLQAVRVERLWGAL